MYCCHQFVWIASTKTVDSSIWNVSCQRWPPGTSESPLNYLLRNSLGGILIVPTDDGEEEGCSGRCGFVFCYSGSNFLVCFCRLPPLVNIWQNRQSWFCFIIEELLWVSCIWNTIVLNCSGNCYVMLLLYRSFLFFKLCVCVCECPECGYPRRQDRVLDP